MATNVSNTSLSYGSLYRRRPCRLSGSRYASKSDPALTSVGPSPIAIVVIPGPADVPTPTPPVYHIKPVVVNPVVEPSNEVITFADKMPEFPGGKEALNEFIIRNFDIPDRLYDFASDVTVDVEFIIDENGNVIDTSGDYPGTIMASAIWHFEATIDKAVSRVQDGTFEASDYGQYSFMGYGGGSLVVDESLISPEVLAKVREREN